MLIDTIVGIDPGTKTAGICVLEGIPGGWEPVRTKEIKLKSADPVLMAERILREIITWHRLGTAVVIEDYRPRTGMNGAAARVLETIGALRYVISRGYAKCVIVQHAEWRRLWTDYTMRRVAAGIPREDWIYDLGEHARDAAKMAWGVAMSQRLIDLISVEENHV